MKKEKKNAGSLSVSDLDRGFTNKALPEKWIRAVQAGAPQETVGLSVPVSIAGLQIEHSKAFLAHRAKLGGCPLSCRHSAGDLCLGNSITQRFTPVYMVDFREPVITPANLW